MKLLLTGLPGVGKTSLLLKLIPRIDNAFWIVSQEIRDENSQRVGFKAKTSDGLSGIFAHKNLVDSAVQLGSYRVDIDEMNRLFTAPLQKAAKSSGFIVLDEIGRMQIKSTEFYSTIKILFSKDTNLLATIRYGDEWTQEFTNSPEVITFTLSRSNLPEIERCIKSALEIAKIINSLPQSQKAAVYKLAKQYLEQKQYIQFNKLFNNAVHYVIQNGVEENSANEYLIKGNHGNHIVRDKNGSFTCDCDLFSGKGQFAGKAGECSHIQAVNLFLSV